MKGLKRYGGTFDETGSGANLNVGLFGIRLGHGPGRIEMNVDQ